MTDQTAPTPETGALSFEQAVSMLDVAPEAPPEQEQDAPQSAPEASAEAVENTEGETSTPEEAEAGAETPDEAGEAEDATEEPVEALEAPRYWSQEAKAKFAELPPELQAVVLSQEGPREEAAAKAKQEASEVRQKAEQEIAQVGRFAEALTQRIPQWQAAFRSRWGESPDWVAHAQAVGAEQATLDKLQYEQERELLAEAEKAQTLAQQQAHAAYIKGEEAKLQGTELADKAKRAEIASYLLETGKDEVTTERLGQISAFELTLAHKAMLWDRAQAALKQAPKPQQKVPAKTPVKPAAAQPSSQQRSATQVANRFAQTRSIDDAVALLLSQG